jgi:hypothetical protein
VALGLADVAAGVELEGVSVILPLAEVAGAADSFPGALAVALGLADVAGVLEALSVSTGATPVPLPETAGAADALLAVIVVPPGTLAPDTAAPATARWQAKPGTARWQADPELARWQAEPAASRWTAAAQEARWRIIMATFDPVAAVSLEQIPVSWTTELAGTTIDPTGQTPGQPQLTVQFAFPVSSGNVLQPAEPVTWYTASWLLGQTDTGYTALCLVGPGGGQLTLTAGVKYDVWSKVTGNPETPAKFAGVLTVY